MIYLFFKIFVWRLEEKKLVSPLLLRSSKELSNDRDKTTLNT